ncbi:MAG: peptidoglycan DD-metalloendopeptidase family protein [Mycetocola sp.]
MTQTPTFPFSLTTVTSGFGRRWLSLNGGFWNNHTGIDFGVARGTRVPLAADGQLSDSGHHHPLWGNWLEYNHGSFKTRYHGVTTESVGAAPHSAPQGAIIARSDQPGASTGPHLHFELVINGKKINPLTLTSHRGTYTHTSGRPADTASARVLVDGAWGKQTITATQKILAHSLVVKIDGIWGTQSVTALQRSLGVMQDGRFGSQTIRAWQKRLRVTVDGIWGRQSVTALQTHINRANRIYA